MHSNAMMLLKNKQSVDIRDYSPITRALSTMYATSKERIKRKFNIAFTILKESKDMAFKVSCWSDDLGEGHKNNQVCASFTSYIALEELS